MWVSGYYPSWETGVLPATELDFSCLTVKKAVWGKSKFAAC